MTVQQQAGEGPANGFSREDLAPLAPSPRRAKARRQRPHLVIPGSTDAPSWRRSDRGHNHTFLLPSIRMAPAGHSSRTQRARSCPNKCAGKPNSPVHMKAPRGDPSQVTTAATSKARTPTHTRTHMSRQDPANVSQPDWPQLAKQRTPSRAHREGQPRTPQRTGSTKGLIVGKHTATHVCTPARGTSVHVVPNTRFRRYI